MSILLKDHSRSSFFHPTKNTHVNLQTLSIYSKLTVWWKCDKGHEWEQVVKNRKDTSPCPECHQLAVSLAKNFPEIAAEWHPTKNGKITPYDVAAKVTKSFWWQCPKKHEWPAPVNNRTRSKTGCPYCAGKKSIPGETDAATTHPFLLKEYQDILNPLPLSAYKKGSHSKLWWTCQNNHVYLATIPHRLEGKGCPKCSNKVIVSGINDLATMKPDLASEWHPTKNLPKYPNEIAPAAKNEYWWQCSQNHEWSAAVYARSAGNGCPDCSKYNPISLPEKKITLHLEKLGVIVEQSRRDILPSNKEIDIYLPDLKIAIEYNGLYWHSERKGKGRTYHYDKWLECKNLGIQLIQIWEDDWKNNPDLILKMLTHKIGLSNKDSSISARKTIPSLISREEAISFLNLNHIQKGVSSTYYYGLKRDNELVAVMTLKKTKGNHYILNRYATSTNVQGGFTKLLSYIERNLIIDSITTFSDHEVSNGNLYARNNFVDDGEVRPDYMYIYKNRRTHKFNFRKSKFKSNPKLIWEDGKTEKELADLNKLLRVWDSGKTRWVKKYVR